MEREMKALSIKQPWAWAILYGGKDIENREWSTNFRGTIAVHASKGTTRGEYDGFYFAVREIEGMRDAWLNLPSFENLIRGAVLGTVEIVGCVKASTSPWFAGTYGFVLKNPQPFADPIPCKGQLGFWDFNEEAK